MSRRGAILQDYGNINHTQTMEAQHNAAQYYQRDKELAAQERNQKATAKQKEGADATKFITELKNEHTGVNDIDIENDKQLLAAKEKMVAMQQKGAPLSEIQIFAMRELPKINNAYTLGKNYKAQVEKGMVDMEKKYGDAVDLKKLQSKAYKNMADDIFDMDEKGNITGYKDPSLIPKNRDYVSEIENDDESLGTVFNPSGSLSSNIKTFPTPSISKSEDKRGKDGRTRYNGYTGQGSVFVEEDVDPETGVTKGLKYKSEKVPLGNKPDGSTNYVEVMPEDEFGLMTQTPSAKKEFDIMFRKHMTGIGIDPTKIDSRARDILKRGYALDWIKETNIDGSAFNPKMKDIQPITKNTTNNNIKVGAAPVEAIDVYTPIVDYFSDGKANVTTGNGTVIKNVMQANLLNDIQLPIIMDKVHKSYPDVTPEDIYMRQYPDGIWVMMTNEPKKISEKDTPLYKLTKPGVNTIANQPYGQKAKVEAAKQGKEQKAESKKTISSTKLKSLVGTKGYEGYTEKEIMEYYKSNGYEIK